MNKAKDRKKKESVINAVFVALSALFEESRAAHISACDNTESSSWSRASHDGKECGRGHEEGTHSGGRARVETVVANVADRRARLVIKVILSILVLIFQRRAFAFLTDRELILE
jgi:hypothetical protein